MWQSIDKETYMQKVIGLNPIESFTDPDGVLAISCGKPQIVTVWGISGPEESIPVVKCEMQKDNRHVLTWDTEYFEYVNPAVKDSVNIDMNNFDPAAKQAEEATEQQAATESAEQDKAMEVDSEEETTEG